MPIYKSNQPIEVIRKTNTKGLEIMVGDQIHVSKYTCLLYTSDAADD